LQKEGGKVARAFIDKVLVDVSGEGYKDLEMEAIAAFKRD
jgi:hypothetical protein